MIHDCPRCSGTFSCGADEFMSCWCTGITLGETQREALARRFRGCLCPGCLGEVAAGEAITSPRAPESPGDAPESR